MTFVIEAVPNKYDPTDTKLHQATAAQWTTLLAAGKTLTVHRPQLLRPQQLRAPENNEVALAG